MRLLNCPVGMFFKQVALRIDHFRLDPNTKVHAALVRLAGKIWQSARQFVGVDLPVAQAGVVVIAWMRVAKPAVVQQKRVRADFLRAIEQRDRSEEHTSELQSPMYL